MTMDFERKPYLTTSVWCAAYLHALGIPLIEARAYYGDRVVFAFDNANDLAWMAGRDYVRGDGEVGIRRVEDSYRAMMALAHRVNGGA